LKDPATEIRPRPSQLKVAKQLQEHFLDDILRGLGAQSECADIPTQTRRTLVEQVKHFALNERRRVAIAGETRRKGKSERR